MKKQYRITLSPIGGNHITNDLTLLAAMYNGGATDNTPEKLKAIADANQILYPALSMHTTVELMDEHSLRVDRLVEGEWITVLALDIVEMAELATEDDLQNVLY